MSRPRSWAKGLLAVVFWAGFGALIWGRPVSVFGYTVLVVGCSILVAVLVGQPELDHNWALSQHGDGTAGRLLVVGAGIAVVAASAVVGSRADTVAVGQSVPATPGLLVAGLVLCVGLGGLVFRWFGWPAALGGGLLVGYSGVVGFGADFGGLLMAVVFSTEGIYGPLTQAATTWLALVCLFIGIWRAGSGAQLCRSRINVVLTRAGLTAESRAIVGRLLGATTTADEALERDWPPQRVITRLRSLFPPSMGLAAFLVAWLVTDAAFVTVVIAGVLPAVLVGSTLLLTAHLAGQSADSQIEQATDHQSEQSAVRPTTPPSNHRPGQWLSLALFIGAPAVVGWLIFSGATLTTALLVGSVSVAVGQFCVQPIRSWLAGNRLRTGVQQSIRTVVSGCLWAVRRLAVFCVLLGALGGVAEVVRTTGVLTAVSGTMFTLSAGQTSVRVALALGVAVGFGWLLSEFGGYVAGAIVCVPLLLSVPALTGLTAHLAVLYAAVLGSALPIPRSLPAITMRTGSPRTRLERWIRNQGPTLAVLAPVSLLPVAVVTEPRLLIPTAELATLWAVLPVWCGMVILAVTAQRLAGRHEHDPVRPTDTDSIRTADANSIQAADANPVRPDTPSSTGRPQTWRIIRGATVVAAGCIGIFFPITLVQYVAVAVGFVGLATPSSKGILRRNVTR